MLAKLLPERHNLYGNSLDFKLNICKKKMTTSSYRAGSWRKIESYFYHYYYYHHYYLRRGLCREGSQDEAPRCSDRRPQESRSRCPEHKSNQNTRSRRRRWPCAKVKVKLTIKNNLSYLTPKNADMFGHRCSCFHRTSTWAVPDIRRYTLMFRC